MVCHFTAYHQNPCCVPEYKPNVYSTLDVELWSRRRRLKTENRRTTDLSLGIGGVCQDADVLSYYCFAAAKYWRKIPYQILLLKTLYPTFLKYLMDKPKHLGFKSSFPMTLE